MYGVPARNRRCRCPCLLLTGDIVDRRRIDRLIVNVNFNRVLHRNTDTNLGHPVLHLLFHGLVEISGAARKTHSFGNDVIGVTRVDLCDAQNRRRLRVKRARYNGLKRADQLFGGHDTVVAIMRHRCVASAPVDGNIKCVKPCHLRARPHGKRTRLQAWPVVQGVNLINLMIVEQPVFDHATRTGFAFLSRLETERDGAGKALCLRQILRRREEHRCVPVMATGVHDALVDGPVGLLVFLGDRQRIHVRAQPNNGAISVLEHADNAGATIPAMHRYPHLLQPFGNEFGCPVLLIGQFRVLVQIMVPVCPGRVLSCEKVRGRHLVAFSQRGRGHYCPP